MDKDTRKRYLEQLAKSNLGEALMDYLQELITKMVDARNFPKENFEVEGKASIKAVAILEKVLMDLELLKQEQPKQKKNQYI